MIGAVTDHLQQQRLRDEMAEDQAAYEFDYEFYIADYYEYLRELTDFVAWDYEKGLEEGTVAGSYPQFLMRLSPAFLPEKGSDNTGVAD